MKKTANRIMLFLLFLLFSLGCPYNGGSGGGGGGGGGNDEDEGFPPKLTVIGSSTNHLYTMISAQPSTKPESNSGPTSGYPLVLTSSVSASSIIASVDVNNKNDMDIDVFNSSSVYNSKQFKNDLFMREMESRVLASKVKQLSKRKSGIDFAPPAGPVVGTTWNDVNVYNGSSFVPIDTTCRAVSTYAYFFVDNRDDISAYLANYCTTFDAIYLENHDKFGTENDIDANGKVIIIFTQELSGGYLGYFYAVDKFSKGSYPESNEGDIFYITTDAGYQGDVVRGTMAHEFQHMIYFDEHHDRGVTGTYTWLNEALSQAAEYYNGYTDNHEDLIGNFLNNGWSGISLTHWAVYNYGYGAIFIRYLIDQYGNTAIKNMCSTNLIGISAVENATGVDFNTIFDNFTRAIVLDGVPEFLANSVYNFSSLNLQTLQTVPRTGLNYYQSIDQGNSISGTVTPYGFYFLNWNWAGVYNGMSLSGNDTVCTVFRISH